MDALTTAMFKQIMHLTAKLSALNHPHDPRAALEETISEMERLCDRGGFSPEEREDALEELYTAYRNIPPQ